ncbi:MULTISPECIES: PLD nuclease N-terminal domain-containing protein [unclassified Brevibacterium]|uniref:PLD nuclease N-terminal domain-containing protein n=1 Tax=unclassified Brevibacterium TaxID=2614124 RepID=UPI001092E75F|nr:PLD nuclease N-terminal domain-containing protein [Brevibacterium sp. S22]TGD30643.1 PLDc_N domain-containing protein [Brevibacterium sp. S22]
MSENPLLPAAYDIVWSGVVLLMIALLVWTLISIARSGMEAPAKLAWVIIVFLLPLIGPICWLAARPKKENSGLS